MFALAATLAVATEARGSTSMLVGFQDDGAFVDAADRTVWLDNAGQAGGRIVRVIASWPKLAPTRPARGGNPADPAYDFAALDELVTNATTRNMHVLITILGTPSWANNGRGENRLPRRLGFLRAFAKGLATRYSGSFQGLPTVIRYSVWNEPNKSQFLAPQPSPHLRGSRHRQRAGPPRLSRERVG